MNKLFFTVMATLCLCLGFAAESHSETSVYKIRIRLYVPRVYDNSGSLGYRTIQRQTICGYVCVDKDQPDALEPDIMFCDMTNRTHKISGRNVTYDDAMASDVMWRYIGSNKTGIFRKPNVKMEIDLNPSYNIGEDEPDNTLIMTLSGRGNTDNIIQGYVTGQIGCGCTTYGHTSPTRRIDGSVVDIAPLCGMFTMRRISLCGGLCAVMR